MIRTRVARNIEGDNLYFGHWTLRDLLARETMTGLMCMAATGRRPSDEERGVLDIIAVALCSADPRIWPLKLTRLVASYGGTLAGLGAGQLAMEGKHIGPWVIGHAASLLILLREGLAEPVNDASAIDAAIWDFIASRRRMVGYGVPLRERDERMEALGVQMSKMGRDGLPYWQLQQALSTAMNRRWRVAPNAAIGIAAILLDLGYSPSQASAVSTFLNQNVFAANAFEAAQLRAPEMQRLPQEHVAYVGPALRVSPRARARGE
ncbi:MAG: hypothetical protein M3O46_22485 [Myxococcota bacterium]|nr:hypothetical protein [Myxococcota bacterium]